MAGILGQTRGAVACRVQTASTSRNLTAGTTVNHSSKSADDREQDVGRRIEQPRAHEADKAGGLDRRGALGSKFLADEGARSADVAHAPRLRLDPPSVETHDRAGDQRDQQIDAHRDGDDLDRLPGLAQRRAGKHREQVGIADRDRERRVLGEVEILVGQRRQDDAHRLRHHDQPQRRAARAARARSPLPSGPCGPTGCRRARSRR